jgi:hypothetical protein
MIPRKVLIETITVGEFEYKKVSRNGKMFTTNKKAQYERILREHNYISTSATTVNGKSKPREIIKKSDIAKTSFVDFRVYIYTAKVYDNVTRTTKAIYMENLSDLTKKNVKFRVIIW